MKELYIFDFDGTLVDSFGDSIKFFNITLQQYNLPTFDLEVEDTDFQISENLFINKSMVLRRSL